jgi:DNA-directed RNA polymerase specialized sigma24 family protein
MQPEYALDALPEIYAAALRLHAAGLDDAAIATRLDLEPAAIGPLLGIGAAKLRALLADAGARDESS